MKHLALSTLFVAATLGSVFAETLPNGIGLPDNWPPRDSYRAGEPMDVPWLRTPPAVIPIDGGRQLFVDDFLIAQTTLTRAFHQPVLEPSNPVLRADREWEQRGSAPMAMPFSDGIWFDPSDRLFKCFYMSGYTRATALAISKDGLSWEKPERDVQPGTNIVQSDGRDSSTVWLDLEEIDPQRRWKMFRSHGEAGRFGLSLHFSADGVHWSPRPLRTGSCGDRSTVFWNPFRRVWVFSLRHGWGQPRARRYWEMRDLLAGPQWSQIDEPPMWVGADRLDLPREDLKVQPQLYNLDAVAYESLLVGLFTIWRGDLNVPPGRPKPNEIHVGFSRDGFHWQRPAAKERRAFLAPSEKQGDWNWGNVQSAGGCFLVVGDELWFYFSGRAGSANRDGGGATGLARLRRDGFASMDAVDTAGVLTTRPLKFSGKHLFVNAAAANGELRVELLDENGEVIKPFTAAKCRPFKAGTRTMIEWEDGNDLSTVAGRAVTLRFHLTKGSLYAFWVSPDKTGASGGYVAAGGPSLIGARDNAPPGARPSDAPRAFAG
jgi:hypothetical protein